jgi:hypothetical protein
MSNHSGLALKAGLVVFSVSSMLLANSIAVAQAPVCAPQPTEPTRALEVTDIPVAQAPICAPSIKPDRSLAVTVKHHVLDMFSFARTIQAILSTMGIPHPTDNDQEHFLKTLLESFNVDLLINPISGLPMRVDKRPEAALDPKKLLDPTDPIGLIPVALFNRLDLAPADWSDCGEYRIIYSFKPPLNPDKRFFLIFEARPANASPQIRFEGCRAMANFWRNLTDVEDPVKRVELLEQFYYTGIAGTAGPIVQAKNYGGLHGQVRGNFVASASGAQSASGKAELREWIIVNSAQPRFEPVTVKYNPLAEFYLDKDDTGPDPILEASERIKFQTEFLNTSLGQLLGPDLYRDSLTPGQPGYRPELDPKSLKFDASKYQIDILNRFGARFRGRFDEFQSVSSPPNYDNPELKAPMGSSVFRADIGTKLGQVVIDPMQKPDATDVLNRAGAVTCGGCHDFTSLQPVGQVKGQPICWPTSAELVHVDEYGNLSNALIDVFLPFRKDRLAEAVCMPVSPPGTGAAAPAQADSRPQTRWQQLLAAARAEKDESKQRAITREAVQAITVLREEQMQKPGYFVVNRRVH